MQQFNDVLLKIESAESVQEIALFDGNDEAAGSIRNQPGKAGSVRVYYHLYQQFGSISVEAAKEGLAMFSEHTADAKENPGKHPNIDRLFNIINDANPLTVKVIMA
jgi:hypothetical protein